MGVTLLWKLAKVATPRPSDGSRAQDAPVAEIIAGRDPVVVVDGGFLGFLSEETRDARPAVKAIAGCSRISYETYDKAVQTWVGRLLAEGIDSVLIVMDGPFVVRKEDEALLRKRDRYADALNLEKKLVRFADFTWLHEKLTGHEGFPPRMAQAQLRHALQALAGSTGTPGSAAPRADGKSRLGEADMLGRRADGKSRRAPRADGKSRHGFIYADGEADMLVVRTYRQLNAAALAANDSDYLMCQVRPAATTAAATDATATATAADGAVTGSAATTAAVVTSDATGATTSPTATAASARTSDVRVIRTQDTTAEGRLLALRLPLDVPYAAPLTDVSTVQRDMLANMRRKALASISTEACTCGAGRPAASPSAAAPATSAGGAGGAAATASAGTCATCRLQRVAPDIVLTPSLLIEAAALAGNDWLEGYWDRSSLDGQLRLPPKTRAEWSEDNRVCMAFAEGKCKWGDKCHRKHKKIGFSGATIVFPWVAREAMRWCVSTEAGGGGGCTTTADFRLEQLQLVKDLTALLSAAERSELATALAYARGFYGGDPAFFESLCVMADTSGWLQAPPEPPAASAAASHAAGAVALAAPASAFETSSQPAAIEAMRARLVAQYGAAKSASAGASSGGAVVAGGVEEWPLGVDMPGLRQRCTHLLTHGLPAFTLKLMHTASTGMSTGMEWTPLTKAYLRGIGRAYSEGGAAAGTSASAAAAATSAAAAAIARARAVAHAPGDFATAACTFVTLSRDIVAAPLLAAIGSLLRLQTIEQHLAGVASLTESDIKANKSRTSVYASGDPSEVEARNIVLEACPMAIACVPAPTLTLAHASSATSDDVVTSIFARLSLGATAAAAAPTGGRGGGGGKGGKGKGAAASASASVSLDTLELARLPLTLQQRWLVFVAIARSALPGDCWGLPAAAATVTTASAASTGSGAAGSGKTVAKKPAVASRFALLDDDEDEDDEDVSEGGAGSASAAAGGKSAAASVLPVPADALHLRAASASVVDVSAGLLPFAQADFSAASPAVAAWLASTAAGGSSAPPPVPEPEAGFALACMAAAYLRAHAVRHAAQWREVGMHTLAGASTAFAPRLTSVYEQDILPALVAQAALLSTGIAGSRLTRLISPSASASAGASGAADAPPSSTVDDSDGFSPASGASSSPARGGAARSPAAGAAAPSAAADADADAAAYTRVDGAINRVHWLHAVTLAHWFDDVADSLRQLLVLASDLEGVTPVPLPAPHFLLHFPLLMALLDAAGFFHAADASGAAAGSRAPAMLRAVAAAAPALGAEGADLVARVEGAFVRFGLPTA